MLYGVLHEHQIRVVTPTYAIPPWLWRRHPEVMRQGADGHAVPFGARQNMDVTNPTYRRYAERITRELLSRYAQHGGRRRSPVFPGVPT